VHVFFKNIFIFLINQGIVYTDWKFDNILLFFTENPNKQLFNNIEHVKLTDFGSILKNNVKIKNVNNINPFFSSPFLNKVFDFITPTHFDDFKSVCYMLFCLNAKKLPWSLINISKKLDRKDFFCTLQSSFYDITFQKLNPDIYFLDTSDCLYWPSQEENKTEEKNNIVEIFSCINKLYLI
jgi:serine/threonine protein kinase